MPSPTDDLEDFMRFEDGNMDEEEAVALFQRLIDSGLAWSLQGSYGRTARSLIDAGLCTSPAAPKES